MKQPGDVFTFDLIDKPKRGRPRKPDALSDAQRARAYRARKRALSSGWLGSITDKPSPAPQPGADSTYWGSRGGWVQLARP